MRDKEALNSNNTRCVSQKKEIADIMHGIMPITIMFVQRKGHKCE